MRASWNDRYSGLDNLKSELSEVKESHRNRNSEQLESILTEMDEFRSSNKSVTGLINEFSGKLEALKSQTEIVLRLTGSVVGAQKQVSDITAKMVIVEATVSDSAKLGQRVDNLEQ